MNERIKELEQSLEAWERRRRRRAVLLVLVPLLVAVGLVLFLGTSTGRHEAGLATALERLGEPRETVAAMDDAAALARLAALGEETAALRRLPDEAARLRAERERAEIQAAVPAEVLLALALRELAGQIGNVEHLAITPDLLTPLLTRVNGGGGAPAVEGPA